jgi:hypothetical protein
MRGRIALALGLIWLTAACDAPPERPTAATVVRDSSGVTVVQNDLTRLTERCEIGSEPRVAIGATVGDPAYQLYRVFGATVLGDGRIALVDQGSQQLRFYDRDGTFLSSSGREGGGPGEFQRAFMLWRLTGDTLWVGDYRPWEFEIFSPSGDWIRQVRPIPTQGNPPQSYGLLADGRSILGVRDVSNRSSDFALDHVHILLHGREGELLDTLDVAPYGRWGQLTDGGTYVYPWFEAVTETAARGDRWVIGHGSTPELRVFDMDSGPRLESIVRWSGVDQTIGASDLADARARLEAQYADVTDPVARRVLLEPMMSDRRPVADAMPVMSDVQFGTTGHIWVAEYARPNRAEITDWLQFDENGRFVCRVTIPSALTVYEFGPDYVLGHREGEMDAEQVVLYELASPGG